MDQASSKVQVVGHASVARNYAGRRHDSEDWKDIYHNHHTRAFMQFLILALRVITAWLLLS
jgi:hypothetical protein